MPGKTYVGDVGTRIEVRTGVDLTDADATALKVKVERRESPAVFEAFDKWAATVKEPAQGGILEYMSQPGDFDEPGTYMVAAWVHFNDGTQYTGETAQFIVYRVFE